MSVTGNAFDFSLLKRLLGYAAKYKLKLIQAILVTIVLACVSPIRPVLVQFTIDTCIVKGNSKGLILFSCVMIALLCFEAILQFADSFLSSLLGQSVVRDLRSDLYQHIINLKLNYFDKNPIGMLVTRAISDAETIADVFSQGFLVIAGDLLKLSVLILVMFITDWRLTLISLTTLPFLIVETILFKNGVKSSFQQVRTQISRLNTFVQEKIQGVLVIQTFSREREELKKFNIINDDHATANIKSNLYYSIFFPIVEILSSISIGLLVWFGSNEIIKEEVSLGNLIAFILYTNMLFRPIRLLADRFNTLQMGLVAAERVFKVLDTNEFISQTNSIEPSKIKGEIIFKDVWFAYQNQDWVLKGISFTVQPGQMLALVGSTGSGKSTIINLLNRFYEFQKGEILIDGISIRDYDLNYLRKNIGLVMQDVFLFSDSIYQNISLYDSTISLTEVMQKAKEIEANEFIEQMPDSYNYNVRERGNTISAGQRQLISFLRAYVHNPTILVLDEATSSIDTHSELLITKAIAKITKNRTSIIVAHRLATIKNADLIIVLDNGTIIEQGSHLELIQINSGKYKAMCEIQDV